jgi:methyl-accepting chemotaxis protein
MRPRSRLFVALVGLDILFNPLIAVCYLGVMGLTGGAALATALQVIVGVLVVRWIAMYAFLSPGLRPLSESEDGAPGSIVRVGRTAYRAPFVVAPTWAFFNAAQWPVVTAVLLAAFPATAPLPPGAMVGTGLISIAIVIGALVVSFPLVEWLLAPTVRRISLAAQSRGITVPGRGLSFRGRLIAMALMLGSAPTLFLSAIAYMADTEHARRALTMSVEAAAATAALAHVEGEVAAAPPIAGAIVFTQRADGAFDPPEIAPLLSDRRVLGEALRDGAARGERASSVSDPSTGAALAIRRFGDGTAVGVVVLEGAGASTATINTLIFFFTIILLWAPMSAYFIARSTAEPVAQISAALRRVRAGEVSHAELVPVLHQDEVGALAESFNAMRGQLLDLIAQANRVTEGDLTVMVDMPGELGDAFRSQVASLRQMVTHTTESAAQLAVAAAEMYAAAQEQEGAAQQQSSGVEEVTRTMESLLEAATHISESTSGVLTKAERTRATTGATAERIAELSAHAGRIAEILDVIREIADRSDLLALNASLEGTRAGEAGRGFSLVAGEMRKLAERVTASVHDIKALVADVRASVSATVMATEESTKLADGTTESARQISLVTQQQRSGTEQAGVSMRDVASMITQSLSATQEIRALAGTLKQQADGLTALVSRFRSESSPAS